MTLAKIIAILCIMESSGDPNAIGDNGNAVGILQIHKIVVDDVNRIYGTSYTYYDRYSIKKSKEMCELYLKHYATEERLGRQPTVQDAARIWNGGPNGYKKKATLPYWEKFKKIKIKQFELTPPKSFL